jgi:hypothetical protein
MPHIIAYVDNLEVWWPPDKVVDDLLRHRGRYTHLVLAFWNAAGPADVAKAWTDRKTFPANAVERLHAAGLKVLVLAGGEREKPTGSPCFAGSWVSRMPSAYATTARRMLSWPHGGRRYAGAMQNESDDIRLLALRDLAAACDLGSVAVVIGGVAVSLLARPRYTHDIDALFMLDTEDVQALMAALVNHGFRPRFGGWEQVAIEARIVAVVHKASGITADIALGCMPFEEQVIQRSRPISTDLAALRLPAPEDLVILKAIANRPMDQEDIRNIAAA